MLDRDLMALYNVLQSNPAVAVNFYDHISNGTFGSEVQEFQKAISAGMEGTRWAPIFENLDPVFTNMTVTQKSLALLPKIAKYPAQSITFEYNRLTALTAQTKKYIFSAELGNPQADDSQYTRKTAPIKVMGTKREVGFVTMKTRNALAGTDVIARENINAATYLSSQLETALFYAMGHDDAGTEVDSYSFDGILRQCLEYARAEDTGYYVNNIIDCNAGSIDPANVEKGVNILRDNYLEDFDNIYLFTPNFIQHDFNTALSPHARFEYANPGAPQLFGSPAKGWISNPGTVWMSSTVLLNKTGGISTYLASPTTGATVPSQPASVAMAITAPTRSWWDAATNVYYRVAAMAHGEESITRAAGSAAAVTPGNAVTLTITPGSTRGSAMRIYKSYDNSTWYWAVDVATPIAGNVTYQDNNLHSGRPWGFLVNLGAGNEPGANDLELRQLAPFFKFMLAQTQLSVPWLYCLLAGLVVRAPHRVVLYKDLAARS